MLFAEFYNFLLFILNRIYPRDFSGDKKKIVITGLRLLRKYFH